LSDSKVHDDEREPYGEDFPHGLGAQGCLVLSAVFCAVSLCLAIAYAALLHTNTRQCTMDDEERESITVAYRHWRRLSETEEQNGGYLPRPCAFNEGGFEGQQITANDFPTRASYEVESAPRDAKTARDVLEGLVEGKTEAYYTDRDLHRRVTDRNVGVALFSFLVVTVVALVIGVCLYGSLMPEVAEEMRKSPITDVQAGYVLPIVALVLAAVMAVVVALPCLSGLALCSVPQQRQDTALCFLRRDRVEDGDDSGHGVAQLNQRGGAVYGVPIEGVVAAPPPPPYYQELMPLPNQAKPAGGPPYATGESPKKVRPAGTLTQEPTASKDAVNHNLPPPNYPTNIYTSRE